ncbi:MAG: hypothetical protein RLZZ561_583 [Pseudomonadota bacterium]|jgi:predicted AlkP superfamily pyrophosphatase or phosphodiesterase
MKGWRTTLVAVSLLSSVSGAAWGAPVLLIAIDGLRPVDVREAKDKNINIPHLRRFMDEGSSARGVQGVLPTVTYPSHTTLLTGAAPARHGIVSNTSFDPLQINQTGWFWYGSDINRDTLWDAAAKVGLSTANVHWPVSVGVRSIRWNLPQIWRTGHEDDAKLLSALATPKLLSQLRTNGPAYAAGIDESIDADENRAQFAVNLIGKHQPEFMTVYLTALDHEQHLEGPASPAAYKVLERIDVLIGKLVAAQMEAHPDAVITIASDHGFAALDTEVNLFRAFIDAGLIKVDAQNKVTSWQAMPWPSGGSAAIILADAADPKLEQQVAGVLADLKKNPELKIDRILTQSEIQAKGGNPDAKFYIGFKPGAAAGGYKGANAPLISKTSNRGTHGYFADEPAMRSAFMIMGPDIRKGQDLGIIDMRSIAPTIAQILGAPLPKAEVAPLDVMDSP